MQTIEQLDLDLLPPNAIYTLIKTGAKKSSPLGYPDQEWTVLKLARLDTMEHDAGISVLLTSIRDGSWFVTSPVIKFDIETLTFETLNSYYKLECLSVN
jgi:hypothetical protein